MEMCVLACCFYHFTFVSSLCRMAVLFLCPQHNTFLSIDLAQRRAGAAELRFY